VTPPTKPKPTDTFRRVIRGGGWDFGTASVFRSAFRYWFTPAYRNYRVGFRCAQRGCLQKGVTPP
jgi:formylglycine-generating enzyme required for sulfatase activity